MNHTTVRTGALPGLRLVVAAAIFSSGAAIAQSSTSPTGAPDANTGPAERGANVAAASNLSQGEIRKVDKDGKTLTIKHGPLKNLDMPGMTMVFGVDDEAVLEKAEVGARVRFQAEKVNGKFIASRIETVR